VLDSIIVSLIRSFTEFLAIGSSGHTILLREVFFLDLAPGTDVAVRFGMIVSVVVAYRADLWDMVRSVGTVLRHPGSLVPSVRTEGPFRELVHLGVGTVPAAVLGVWYGPELAAWGTDIKLVSTFVILGGLMLFLTRLFRRTRPGPMTLGRAILVGIGQALAIIPGLPRMAAAMSFGVYAGLEPRAAARFSILLALPALVGVILVGMGEGSIWTLGGSDLITFVAVLIAAAVAGWLGIKTLLSAMRSGAIRYVALYCLLIGLLGIIFL
jgi:undecaprenyl-diphosphatase